MPIQETQRRKARTLLELHHGGNLLVLPNIWDPIGARVLQAHGYRAVATASAAISASLGYMDGERLALATMLERVGRICRAVDLPVTADMEAGYAADASALEVTTRALVEAGAVGMNIEDSLEEGGALRPAGEQADRIARVRDTAAALGLHLVINARVDTYLSYRFADDAARLEATVERAEAYARAGADCIYPIGRGDRATLEVLRSRIRLPLNVLATPDASPLATLQSIGINRVSFGPFLFRSCLRKLADIVATLAVSGDYASFSRETLTSSEATAYLTPEREPPPA